MVNKWGMNQNFGEDRFVLLISGKLTQIRGGPVSVVPCGQPWGRLTRKGVTCGQDDRDKRTLEGCPRLYSFVYNCLFSHASSRTLIDVLY